MFLLVRFRRAAAAVPLCSPEKEERLHDKHLSRRSRHPAGAFSRYCTFQSKDGGEIWRQYSQTPPLWRILTWRQRHIQKEPGYKWNTTWLYSQYSSFPLKIQILGFFSWRAAPCCIFVIHNPSVKHYITGTPLLLLGVIDAFLSAYCFFFITLERIKKKAALIQVHNGGAREAIPNKLQGIFKSVFPYIYDWRRHKNRSLIDLQSLSD